jgi:hypothetical protein
MGGFDRVEVLYAAQLEGPGQNRWSKSSLTVAAVSQADQFQVMASFADIQYSRPRELWTFSIALQSEGEAVALVRAIVDKPSNFIEQGRAPQTGVKPDVLRSLFDGLKPNSQVDTTRGVADLARDAITVGMGRYLAAQVESGADLEGELRASIERYLALAPFSFGYWAPYKRMIKALESRVGAHEILAIALARIDGQLDRVSHVDAPDKLQHFVPTASTNVAGPNTVAYLMRRGRRWLRRLGRHDGATYARAASAFLRVADAQGAQVRAANRLILADTLYGRGAIDATHGRGAMTLPAEPDRYARRYDRFSKIWDQHIEEVTAIWAATRQNADIQAWAFSVLKSQRQPIPDLSPAGLKLALLGPSEKLRSHACAQIAYGPDLVRHIDAPALQILLKFCTPRQFSSIYPALEKYAGTKSIDDAVFAHVSENGMPEIRRGGLPASTDTRSAALLQFSLRFIRARFNAADTYQLARYVGLTTKFKPVSRWQDTLKALPLKSLVELRIQLTDLPRAVVTAIDAACLTAAMEGSGDVNLAAALTLSPSRELRELGWSLLSNAGDPTIATVWDNLISQAGTSAGREALVEAIRNEERVARIERHPLASQILSNLVLAVAATEQKLAERLFLRLASQKSAEKTLETLRQILRQQPSDSWASRPALLQKAVSLDPGITQLVWASLAADEANAVAEIYLRNRSLADVMIGAVEVDYVKQLGQVPADYLMRALRAAPSRLLEDKTFAVSCAICPHPDLQQFAIAKLEARGLIKSVFVPLAESGMPAATAAADRYIASVQDRAELTKAVVTICDSGRAATRASGLRFLAQFSDRIDMNAAMASLAEHTAPDVAAVVAEWVASGLAVRRETLQHFDNRVLRTRRVGRKAKELVKNRLGTRAPQGTVSIEADLQTDGRRVEALLDLARGASLRDREWALQQLARLALEGHVVPQVQVSTTS